MNELTIGDKIYISSKRAAEITGYAKDYVGQLCREGHVEAKMVGRSWYVLESSIRAHRFGAPKAAESLPEGTPEVSEENTEDQIEEKVSPVHAWESPRYTPEVPEAMPKVEGRNNIAQNLAMSESDSAITDMQTAWKEWFETKRSVAPEAHEEVEEPPVTEEEELEQVEEEATPIPMHRVREPEPQITRVERVYSDIRPVEVHRHVEAPVAVHAPVRPHSVRHMDHQVEKQGSNIIATSLLIVVALIVIALGAIGTGYAGKYFSDNAFVRYIEGTSSVNKQ